MTTRGDIDRRQAQNGRWFWLTGCAISPADWGRLWAAREEEVEAPNAG